MKNVRVLLLAGLAVLFLYPFIRYRQPVVVPIPQEAPRPKPEVASIPAGIAREHPPMPVRRSPPPTGVPPSDPKRPMFIGLTPERARMLYEVANFYVPPSINIHPDRGPMTREEVLMMYPSLRRRDGTIDEQKADEIQARLQLLLEMEQRRQAAIKAGQTSPPEEIESQRATQRKLYMEVAAMTRPTRGDGEVRFVGMAPTEELLAISPSFASYGTSSLQNLAERIARDQTYTKIPFSRIYAGYTDSLLLQGHGTQLTEDDVRRLLSLEIDRLFKPILSTNQPKQP